ncbi:MAG: hypothetical protein FJX73_03240 [Armatimonadetes bacterium]|nr:hypothetical protein [Armatimonadota bacterium]
MNHRRTARLLSAYLDAELSSEEMAEVQGHLAGCLDCSAELGELRATRRLLSSLEAPDLPQGFAADLQLRLWRRAPGPWAWLPVWEPRPATALAVLALVLALVSVPAIRGHQHRLRAAEIGPDLFLRRAAQAQARDPLMDRAFVGLVFTDANLRLIGEDPRGPVR